MPQIPLYQQQTRASGNLGAGPSGNSGTSIGEGLLRLADAKRERDERNGAAEASLAMAKARTDAQRDMLERQRNAEPGAPDFTKTLLEDFDERSREIVQGARTKSAKRFLELQMQNLRGDLEISGVQFEAQASVAHRKQQFEDAGDEVAAAAELNPDDFQKGLAEHLATIEASGASPMERQELRRSAVERVTQRAAIGYARRDPEKTLERLARPGAEDALFRSLTPRARDAVYREVEDQQRIRLQAEDRAYRDSERAERDVQDAMSKTGDALLARGQLSAEWVSRNKDRLSAADVRYFYRSLSGEGGGGATNSMIYADLRDRAGRGEDVRGLAREALQRGEIQSGDYDRILGEVEGERPGWYSRGSAFISTSAAVSDLNPDPAAAQRKAQMLDDWDDWARRNPQATDQQAREEYQRVVREYAIVDYEQMTLVERAPRFLAGSRHKPDLETTEASTVEAFQSGRITQEEFEAQAALIERWRRSLEATVKREGTQ